MPATIKLVVNNESDEPKVLGTYERSIEDTIVYRNTDGVVLFAPEDCVSIVELDLSGTPWQERGWWVHKRHISQQYGGPEEGGWWYDHQSPISPDSEVYMAPEYFNNVADAINRCLNLHVAEVERRSAMNIKYTSVLSHREDFFTYGVYETPVPAPSTQRPHYE